MREERFKPSRAGVINLWDYINEVFHFADGRLLLRGPNGAGKTKALEVLFPFVLDGRTDARRLDPYSGDERTMKENLLYRGHDAAYGYAWMEFARNGERVCIGVGMRAQRHAEGVKPWFFVTDKTLDRDFRLVDGEGRPLTRNGLAEAIGAESVLDRAVDYRGRINQRLFGLADDRYEGMLNLVLTLRKPKIAEKLDPDELSKILSRGLRPLDDELLDQAAKSFEDLEAVQREIDRLGAAHRELESFLGLYRGYVRTHARHRMDVVVSASRDVKEQITKVALLETAVSDALIEESSLKARVETTGGELVNARSRRDALKESPGYQAANQLAQLEGRVSDARSTESSARAEFDIVSQSVSELAEKAAAAEASLAEARAEAGTSHAQVSADARECGVAWTEADAAGTSTEIKQRLFGRLAARTNDIKVVRDWVARVGEASTGVKHADSALEEATRQVQQAEQDLAQSERAADEARANLLGALGEWAQRRPSDVLADGDLASLKAAVPLLGEEGAQSLAEILSERFVERRAAIASEIARLEQQLGETARKIQELEDQREKILAEKDDAPVAWPTRPADRAARAGAPLWRLVRFRAGFDTATEAGIEAALEAAGLLDAWLSPGGDRPDPAVLDAFLVPEPRPAGTRTLADVLEPEEQPDVPRERVEAFLATIGLETLGGLTAVGTDGTYRVGPILGAFTKVAPQFIGATARAARRRERVAVIESQLRELDDEKKSIEGTTGRLEERRAALAQAVVELPSSGTVLSEVRAVTQAAGALRGARKSEETAKDKLNTWKRLLAERKIELTREAQNRELPAEQEALDAVAGVVQRLAQEAEKLVGLCRLVEGRDRETTEWRKQHNARLADRERAEGTFKERSSSRAALEVELETLRATIGVEAEEVLRQLAEVEAKIVELTRSEKALQGEYKKAGETRAAAESDRNAARTALEGLRRAEQDAVRRFVPLGRGEFVPVLGVDPAVAAAAIAAAPDLEASADSTPVAALVSAIAEATRGVSPTEDRRKAALTQVNNGYQQLSARLGPVYRADLSFDDELVQVRIADDEGVQPVAAFAAKLDKIRREQELLLTARERELFEETLLGSLCRQIHTRTSAAHELVRQMDRSMRQRRMSSQKTVGVTWELEDSLTPEQKLAVKLLEHEPAHLSPDQLDELRGHFSAEVKTARAGDASRSYRQILASVLDYRAWRKFALKLVGPDQSETPLTRARHAKLSTGEKALSLHLPLFGAAHAQFASAKLPCPRLVALDEAFATIDANGKPELLALSVDFDLDLFMTGYDLWATYPTVPAVAHYDLMHVEQEHTVSAMLLLWNGHELSEGRDAEQRLREMCAS